MVNTHLVDIGITERDSCDRMARTSEPLERQIYICSKYSV